MTQNPYEPPKTPTGDQSHETHDDNIRDSLSTPTLAYTANGNLEAHSVVTWLQSHGIRAYAVEDNSGVNLFMFGTVSQLHKPQVFVDKADLKPAGDLLRQFEEQRNRRRSELNDLPPIQSRCEECRAESGFPASQDGTTQNCPKCNAFMDVGTIDWPDDFDFSDNENAELPEMSDDEAMDAALRLEKRGDWIEAISAYRDIVDRWPEHATYASNCIASIQRKLDAADGL